MATENVEVAVTESGAGTNALAAASRKLADEMDRVQSSSDKTVVSTKKVADAANDAGTKVNSLGSAIGQTTTGFSSASSALGNLGASAIGASSGMDRLAQTASVNTDYQRELAARSQELNRALGGTGGAAASAGEALGSLSGRGAAADATWRKFGLTAKQTASDIGAVKPPADQVSETISKLGSRLNVTGRLFTYFAGVASSVAAALSISKYLELAEAYTTISNKLKLVSKDSDALSAAMQTSLSIANSSRTEWAATAGVYAKVTQALQGLRKDTSLATGITTTLTQAVALSGTSAESAKAGLTQFQQGLASGVLRGEEFNSVVENTPGLARALAQGLGVSTAALRSMANNGLLTTTKLIEGLSKAAPQVAAAFAQTTPTVAQATAVWNNSLTNFVGKLDQATGFSATLARGILLLSNNMNIVAPVALALGAALALLIGPLIIGQVVALGSALMATLLPAIAANAAALAAIAIPVAAVIAGFAAMVVGATALYTAVSMASQYFTTATATVSGFVAQIISGAQAFGTWATGLAANSEILKVLIDAISSAWDYVKGIASSVIEWAKNNETLNAVLKVASDFVQKLWKNLSDLWDMVKKYIPSLDDANNKTKELYKSFGDAAGGAGNFKKSLFELNAEAQKSGDIFNSLGEKIGNLKDKVKQLGDGLGYATEGFGKTAAAANNAASGINSVATAAANAASQVSDLAGGLGSFDSIASKIGGGYGSNHSGGGSSSGGGGGGGGDGGFHPDYGAGGIPTGVEFGGFSNDPYPGIYYQGTPVATALYNDPRVPDIEKALRDMSYLDIPQPTVNTVRGWVNAELGYSGASVEESVEAWIASQQQQQAAAGGTGFSGGSGQSPMGGTRSAGTAGSVGGAGLSFSDGEGFTNTNSGTTNTPTPSTNIPTPVPAANTNTQKSVQIIINTPDYNSMRRSQKQIANDALRGLIQRAG